ncbi:MAG: DUF4230 domain-containing protein [Archangium sp.]|nr:DUF4230 domain-containing protein [Archangium sp.]
MANLLRAAFVLSLIAVMTGVCCWLPQPARAHDTAAVLTQMREVARLETLEVSVYRKVAWEPEVPPSTSLAGDVLAWAKHSIAPRRGRAIVFATAHIGLDLSRLGPDDVHIVGDSIEVVLPPTEVRVELLPRETEVVASNLDSAQTAALLEKGRLSLEHDVRNDTALRQRARASSERALKALLTTFGFRNIRFVERAPHSPAAAMVTAYGEGHVSG